MSFLSHAANSSETWQLEWNIQQPRQQIAVFVEEKSLLLSVEGWISLKFDVVQ